MCTDSFFPLILNLLLFCLAFFLQLRLCGYYVPFFLFSLNLITSSFGHSSPSNLGVLYLISPWSAYHFSKSLQFDCKQLFYLSSSFSYIYQNVYRSPELPSLSYLVSDMLHISNCFSVISHYLLMHNLTFMHEFENVDSSECFS